MSKWASAELKSRPVSQNELKREVKTQLELDELMGLTVSLCSREANGCKLRDNLVKHGFI